MGCWNETCALTNLPIMAGDEVVVIPLVKKEGCGKNYYWHSDASPLTLPIEGEYDEYGSIENIKISDITLKVLENMDLYILENEKYVPFTFTLEVFFDNLPQGNLFLKYYIDKYSELDMVMYHKGAYETVIKEMSSRIPYQKKETIFECQKESLKKKLLKKRELANTLEEPFKQYIIDKSTIYGECTLGYKMTNAYDKIVTEETMEEYLENLTKAIMFFDSLNCLRKSFYGMSGLGSQGQEMYMHKILAMWVIDFYNNRYEDFLQDGYDEREITDTVFWFDDEED